MKKQKNYKIGSKYSILLLILSTMIVSHIPRKAYAEKYLIEDLSLEKSDENKKNLLELTLNPLFLKTINISDESVKKKIITQNSWDITSKKEISQKIPIEPFNSELITENTTPEDSNSEVSTAEITPEDSNSELITQNTTPEDSNSELITQNTTPENPNSEVTNEETTPENPNSEVTNEETTPENPNSETPTQEPRVLVAEVLITGVEGELKDLIYNIINTQPGRTITRSQLQEDLNTIYATGYFAKANVTPENTPLGIRINFIVEANPILTKVQIETLPENSSSILPPEIVANSFEEQYGIILNLRDLQEGIQNINKWYTDNGYDLAQVVGAPQIEPDGTVTLIIAEGILQDIQVRYFNDEDESVDGKTRDFIVTREIQLKPGQVFNRRTAQRDLQRVFGLGVFEDVRLSFSPGENPSEVIMNVDVVETNTGSLAAGAGISSTSGLFGTISYQEQNLGGNNQTIGTEFQLGERELLFDVSFTDPWIGGDPYRTSYTINGFRRRSISLVYDGTDTTTIRTEKRNDSPRVVRTGGGITFARPLAPDVFSPADWVLTAGFQYQHIQVEDASGEVSGRSGMEFGNQKLAFNNNGIDDLFIFRLSASQDNRDNSLRPTSGSLLLLGMDQTAPIGSGSIFFNRIRGSYSYYIPVEFINFDFTEGPQALAFNIQSGTVVGDLPPYEAFVVGGSNSVRGYGEGDLANGRSYFQATAEYRFPIVSFLGGALFFDYGSSLGSGGAVIGKPSEVRGLNGSGYGYGLGVRVQSPVGPIRIDYAINDEGDNRIHFGIGEKF